MQENLLIAAIAIVVIIISCCACCSKKSYDPSYQCECSLCHGLLRVRLRVKNLCVS